MQGKSLWITAVVFGLLSSLFVFQYISGLTPKEEPPQLVSVVVASRNIGRNTAISREMVETRKIPLQAMHPEALLDIQALQGRIAVSEIVSGEQILNSRLLPFGNVPGMSFTIPPDRRALTIAVNEVIGVGGFVKPGDHVDILATFDTDPPQTITVIEHVQILAIAQDMEVPTSQTAKVSTSVTIAVSPRQAEAVTLAEEEGRLRLALRPPNAVNSVAGAQEVGNIFSVNRTEHEQTREVVERPVEAPRPASKEQPAVVEVRKVQAPPPEKSDWVVEVIRGIDREVRVVYE